MDSATELAKWFHAGGFVMYPLVLFSILTWSVILERAWGYRNLRQGMMEFKQRARELLVSNNLTALETLCRERFGLPTADIVFAGIDRSKRKGFDGMTLQRAMERQRGRSNQELRRGLWVLGTIATAAPFVGLFGTVVGILRSFQEMARSGVGGFGVVAAGISEALIATAVGIGVAVIAALAFNALNTRVSRLALFVRHDAEELAEELLMSLMIPSRNSLGVPSGKPGETERS